MADEVPEVTVEEEQVVLKVVEVETVDHEDQDRCRRILVALDGGEESNYALSWCIQNVLSPETGDMLILLHVVPSSTQLTVVHPKGSQLPTDVVNSMESFHLEVSDSVIEKAVDLCKNLDHVKIEKRVEKGDARDVICSMVEKEKADVLVLGTHGYGFIRRAFLGSVSSHCAQNAKCPVLVVKRPKQPIH